ncbi:MAG: MSCRAMM family protein [Solirubrobacterales bacterium]
MTSGERNIGRKSLVALLALAASLCLTLALAPANAIAAGSGSISGTVTDAETAEPVEGVEVCAWPLSFENEEEEFFGPFCEDTDASGEYTLSEVPNGEYEVEFWGVPQGYLIQFYDGEAHGWEADPVTVKDSAVTGIDAELLRGGEIEGTVTRSSDGEPVEGVEVCAFTAAEEEFAGCELTESNGTYALGDLEPGEYKVEFWPAESGQNLAYQFYDHRDRWEEADVVEVEAGQATGEIDAELEPGALISGTVTSAATGATLREVPVCSIDPPTGQLWICDWTDSSGHYDLPFLSKGEYKVAFSLEFREFFGEEAFPGEENDGYPTQFWNNQSSLATANVIPLATGQSASGIDAHLGTPPAVTPPPTVPPVVHRKKHKHCHKGFVKKKVKGKVRCVKRHKHRHQRRHHRAARLDGFQSPLFPGAQRPPFRVVR